LDSEAVTFNVLGNLSMIAKSAGEVYARDLNCSMNGWGSFCGIALLCFVITSNTYSGGDVCQN